MWEDQQFKVNLSYFEFEATLGYMRACLKKKQKNIEIINRKNSRGL